jgi:uncharacterized protein YbaP (TraB family)
MGRLARYSWYFILVFVLGSHVSISQNTDYKLLWKISHKGIPQPSFLFGTMHIQDERVFGFSDSVLIALDHSQTFASEVDLDKVMTDFLLLMFKKDSVNYLKKSLSTDQYKKLESKVQEKLGVKLENMNTKDTWLLDLLNNDFEWDKSDKQKQTFLDAYLFYLGKQKGKNVTGLESLSDYSKWNNALSDEERASMLINTSEIKESKDSYEELLKMYLRGDVDKLYKVFIGEADPNSFVVRSLNYRNHNMVIRLDSMLKKQTVFTAVGAAHLAGDSGMVALLQKRGYSVVPVMATFKNKGQIPDLKETDYQWVTKSMPNSTFAFEMPSEPVNIPYELDIPVEYNALASFDFYRMNHFMAMNMKLGMDVSPSKTETTLNTMLDNMSKEYPTILSRKFYKNTFPQRAECVMRKGKNYYRVGVSLNQGEVLMLLLSGDKKAMTGKAAQHFYESIKVQENKDNKKGIKEYVNEKLAFKVQMPENSKDFTKKIERGEDGDDVTVHMRYNNVPWNGITFMSAVYEYEGSTYIENPREIVHEMAERITSEKKPEETGKDSIYEGYPMQQFGYGSEEEGSFTKGRFVVRDNRIYLMMVSGKKEGTESTAAYDFLSSLVFLPYKNTPYTPFIDSDSTFRVLAPPLVQKDSSYSYSKESYFPSYSKSYTYSFTDAFSATKYGAVVYLLDKYGYVKNPREMFDSIKKNLTSDTIWTVEKEEWSATKEKTRCSLLLKNKYNVYSNYLFYLFQDKFYEFYAVNNMSFLLDKEGAGRFFSSCTLFPQKKYILPADKTPALLKDLASSDSATAQGAYAFLSSAEIEKSNYTLVSKALDQPYPLDSIHRYNKTREALWEAVLRNSTKDALLFAEKKYAGSSPSSKMEILRGLAGNGKDSASVLLFKKLLLANTPKVDSCPKSEFHTIHWERKGSLLFPEIGTLLSNKVFQDYALYTLLQLSNDSSVAMDQLAPFQDRMLDLIQSNVLGKEAICKDDWTYGHYFAIQYLVAVRNERAKKLLEGFLHLEDPYTKFGAFSGLMDLGSTVDPKEIKTLSQDIYYRLDVFKVLKEKNKLSLFPKELLNQKSLAVSDLANSLNRDDYYIDDKNIEVLKEKTMTVQGKKYRAYLIKFKLVEDETWYVGLSAPHNTNKAILETSYDYTGSSLTPLKDKSLEEHYKELTKYIEGIKE